VNVNAKVARSHASSNEIFHKNFINIRLLSKFICETSIIAMNIFLQLSNFIILLYLELSRKYLDFVNIGRLQ